MADINVIVLPDGTEYPVSDYYLPVAISNPTDGQVLKYDATNQVWYNGDDAEGSSVFYGTSAPTSQLGVNGNLYVKYTEGTGGASDTVDDLYVKLDGDWCQISTGGGGGTSDYNYLTNKPQINSVELSGNKSLDDLGIQPSEISKTATGSIVTFSDGGDDIPVSEYECEIVAQQASGTPTPDNPLSITGFSQADIAVCGKNLINALPVSYTANTQQYPSIATVYLKQGVTYTISCKQTGTPTSVTRNIFLINKYDVTPFTAGYIAPENLSPLRIEDFTFTVPQDYDYKIYLWSHGININLTYDEFQLEKGTTATPYEPYTNNTYIVEFGQTIYGGRLIYSNGQWAIEATHISKTFDGSETWYQDGIKFYTTWSKDMTPAATGIDGLCSHYQVVRKNFTNIANGECGIGLTGITVSYSSACFGNSSIASVADFKTWLSNNPLQLVYELETPVIIPLTSTAKIKTLPGVNNIFSNTGDSTVKYFTNKADKIAELVKAEIASTNTDYHKYSTEEKIVGEWVDGKTIYERTYTFTAPSSNAFTREDLGIPMSNISNAWIDVQNSFAKTSGMCSNVAFYDGNSTKPDQFGGYLNFLQTNLAFDYRVGSDLYGSNLVLTIRYTKSS